ncbi:MAG: hypothetical protein II297_00495, partial [Clostridia bacterium]|nr:hypothetical protein [Clostridia bacterium]
GGIALQLGMGFTIGYLVNTIGTLITAPSALHMGGTIGGAIAVAAMIAIVIALIANNNKRTAIKK